MGAKEYLKSLRELNETIAHLQERKAELVDRSRSIEAVDTSKVRVRSSYGSDRVGDILTDIEALDGEIISTKIEYIELMDSVINQLHKLSDANQLNCLHRRYVLYRTYDEIAAEMSLSQRQVINIHGKALKEFEKIIS